MVAVYAPDGIGVGLSGNRALYLGRYPLRTREGFCGFVGRCSESPKCPTVVIRDKFSKDPTLKIMLSDSSQHAHFQMEQGRPNSSFLHIGCSARKAISAGLHKESPMENGGTGEDVEERRATFWAVYFLETLVHGF